MIALENLIEEVPSITPAYRKKLKTVGIKTVHDLLYYFPVRYNDFSDIISIDKIKNGTQACVQGHITDIGATRTFKKWMHLTEATIEDDTGSVKAVWFNQPYIATSLKEEDFVCLAGKVSLGKGGLYLQNPAYEKIAEFTEQEHLTHTGRIVPVYSETKGLTSRWLRYMIRRLLEQYALELPETLPQEVIKKYHFLAVTKAIKEAHFPSSFEAADAARARFAFEELLILQLAVLRQKARLLQKQAPACPMDADLMKQFTKSLSFTLTDSQKKCSYQILKDLEKSIPMSRLLEGDVGSGKTVVAAMAALSVAKSAQSGGGWQTAFMAPTEILAKQHFTNLCGLLKPFNISIGFLTGKESLCSTGGIVSDVSKKAVLEGLRTGAISIVIGTHALISKGVEFSKLALVVLDEQHRFGVSQRAALVKRGPLVCHLLSMTATPIPRTLALTLYGDLDLSLITEMPKNRKKVKTLIVAPNDRKAAYEFIRSEVKKGKGAFVICPKIESKEQRDGASLQYQGSFAPYAFSQSLLGASEIKSVNQEYQTLSKDTFPDLRLAMLHGKMKAEEKERIMQDFKSGQIDILVSTSVVEVGVDVPRATVMVIEGAERFGLAQLHQFRGRVGRSEAQSYCFLFTTSADQLERKRLKALVASHNGFQIAEKDLEIRGPGQLYGTQQSGINDAVTENISNIFLVEKTRNTAKEILEQDPELKSHPLLQKAVAQFTQRLHFE